MSASSQGNRVSATSVAARVGRVLASLSEFMKVVGDLEIARADPQGLCNFMAGSPQEMAPRQYVDALKRQVEPLDKDWYGYKMAHRPAQEAAADGLSRELGIAFQPDDILLARGAHGALGAALGAIVDAGDEVIFVSPPWFFYEAMILGVGATPIKTRVAPPAYDLDLKAIAEAITPRTRMLLLNTPHNPTGRIFPVESLKAVAETLERGFDAPRPADLHTLRRGVQPDPSSTATPWSARPDSIPAASWSTRTARACWRPGSVWAIWPFPRTCPPRGSSGRR